VLALQPLHGVTFGLWFVSAVAICRARGGAIPTAAQGLFAGASSAGSAIGMAFAGELLAAGGGGLLFGAASLVALAGAAMAWSSSRERAASGIDDAPTTRVALT
jgi:hypothetical protein